MWLELPLRMVLTRRLENTPMACPVHRFDLQAVAANHPRDHCQRRHDQKVNQGQGNVSDGPRYGIDETHPEQISRQADFRSGHTSEKSKSPEAPKKLRESFAAAENTPLQKIK